jgi:hypothetical protein
MAYLAGDTIQDRIVVLDQFGDPSALDAASVFTTAIVYTPSGGTSVPTVATTGTPGLYEITFPTSRSDPGLYSLILVTSEAGTYLQGNYDVDPLSATPSTLQLGAPSVTFSDFRADIGDALQDHLRLSATEDGEASVFHDEINLTDSPDAYRGSHGIYVSATDPDLVGKLVRVESSSPTTNTITFSPELPAITRAGDVLDLFNMAGYGWRLQYYDTAIRGAIESAYPDYVIDTVADGATVFDEAVPTIAIPDLFVAVYGIELTEPDTLTQRNVSRARKPGTWGVGWSVDRGLRQLRIDGTWRDEMAGGAYRIRGYARHAVPTAPTDGITLDLAWLTHEVKARLAARKGATNNQWQNWAVEWGRLASEERGRIMTPREANTVWL